MRPAVFVTIALAAGLSACGSDDDDSGAPAPAPEGAVLSVVVQPKGSDGPSERRRVECERLGGGSTACRGLSLERLAPVPPETACAEIYGGPAVARVRGVVDGKRIDERFSRVNACEIERWDRNVALLGRAALEP